MSERHVVSDRGTSGQGLGSIRCDEDHPLLNGIGDIIRSKRFAIKQDLAPCNGDGSSDRVNQFLMPGPHEAIESQAFTRFHIERNSFEAAGFSESTDFDSSRRGYRR